MTSLVKFRFSEKATLFFWRYIQKKFDEYGKNDPYSFRLPDNFQFLFCLHEHILNWLFSLISSVKSLANMEKTILIASAYPTISTCTHNLCFIWEDRSFCKFLTTVRTKLHSTARCWCERIWHNVWSWFNPYCKLVFRFCFRIYLNCIQVMIIPSCAIFTWLNFIVIFDIVSADIITMSADTILKMTIKLSQLKIVDHNLDAL